MLRESACGQGKPLLQARGSLAAMMTANVVHCVRIYNIAISACTRSEQWQLTFGLLAVITSAGVVGHNAAISAWEEDG